jgi:carbonic anhydrase/acetyltransferase-like protein (isoleucine patch superfamily)
MVVLRHKGKRFMEKSSNASLRCNPNGDLPDVDPTAYVDPSAQVIGNVHIGPKVYIGPNAVIRADESDGNGDVQPVVIESGCNVQDGVIVHALAGTQVRIGARTSLAHGCIIHGPCIFGEWCFVGFRAVVFDATLGDGVFIDTSAVVQGVDLPANALVGPGVVVSSKEDAAKQVGTTSQANVRFREDVVAANQTLADGYGRLSMK